MRALRCFGILCMALGVLAAGVALSGCGTCPLYNNAVARVRLLNGDTAGPHMVYFHFYPHGAPQVPEDALASGSFFEGDGAEEYATRDGKIYIFEQGSGGDGFDVHVFVDVDNDGVLTTGDMERLVTNVSMVGDYVVEVDYLDFTMVD